MARVFCLLKMLGGFCGCLMNFIFFGLRVTTNFTVVFIMKCTNILCTVFASCFSHVPYVQVEFFFVLFCFGFFFTSKEKSKLCRVVFLYVVVLAEQ